MTVGSKKQVILDNIAIENNADYSDAKLWSDSVTKAFIDIMLEEVTKGNMPNGVFNTRTWNDMTIKLNSITGRSCKRDQLKAKMHRLRATYREFYALVHHSGFDWNAETNTVTASPEVWHNYLRVHEKDAQFHKKGLEHYKLLEIIFNKNNATGVLHHASTQDPPNTDEEVELENQYLNSGSNIHIDKDNSDDDVQELEQSTHSGKQKPQAKCQKSKKTSSSNQMGEALASWAEACAAKTEMFKRVNLEGASSLVTPDCSATKCLAILEELGDISDDIYVKSMEKFRDSIWREMFIAMPEDRRRAWVARL